jgi:NitT/TauT family transport system substrate-binding protein
LKSRALAVGCAIVLLGSSTLASCSDRASVPVQVTLGAVPTELNALVYVAEDTGIFAREGIDLQIRGYESGAASAAGMLNGEADIALAAEFPIVRHVLNGQSIVNLGTVAKYENTFALWQHDSGIYTLSDLKGRRVGVTLTTISEYYLGMALHLNGADIKDVSLVEIKANEAKDALLAGKVDAVVTWEPWVSTIQDTMGDRVTTQSLQGSQYAYWNLVTSPTWCEANQDAIDVFLKCLAIAEEWAASHEGEAKQIVTARMGFDPVYTDLIWPRYQFQLSLGQELIAAMEHEARWLIGNGQTIATRTPDFLESIQEDHLRRSKPASVSIIR